MNSGSSPWAPRYLTASALIAHRPRIVAGPAGLAARAAADPRRRIDLGALDLRDDALDRPAGHELDDGECHQHDPEQGRDHQQQAFEDIGAHGAV